MDLLIRFYSNENLDADLVQVIREFGYDVLTSYEANQANQSIPDNAVLQYAIADNRCILTFDRSDFLTLHRSMINHCGIVACREMNDDYSVQVQALHEYVNYGQANLQNRFLRLLKRNKPESSQQTFFVREYFR